MEFRKEIVDKFEIKNSLNLIQTPKDNIVIAEMAGADSLAAIYLYLKNNPNHIILPTLIITPNENEKNKEIVLNNYNIFINFLRNQNFKIFDLQILNNDYELWNKLMDIKFISPCIACHLYCHLMRLPLAKKYKGKILTGEREKHNNSIKINQNDLVLKYFDDYFKNCSIQFIKPLLKIQDTNQIELILKDIPFDIKNKNNFIKCNITKLPFEEKHLIEFKTKDYLIQLQKVLEEYLNEFRV